MTGGAGFVGSHIVDRLIDDGHDVLVVDDLSTGVESNVNHEADLAKLDIGDPSLLDLASSFRPDAISHCAAQKSVPVSVSEPLRDAVTNIVGGINDVAEVTRRAHAAGALVCADGVAYAPHRALDVKAWDVDFYLCSLYKLYGPHLSLLYGKAEHLARAHNNNHYFLADDVPLKLNPGGPNHELTAALSGITDYFDILHRHHFRDSNLARHDRIKQVYGLMADHEERIAAPFVEFLRAKKGVRLIGRQTADRSLRAPTFSFTVAGRRADEIPAALLPFKLAIASGDFYAARCIRDLGLESQGGVVRASMVHYNTEAEVTRLIEGLDSVI